ncbi:MAG TPA: class I SAM-dependent methyltransferase [Candidatus Eisenbacteria bacterium]|nr:class I SAM-dependent methyltransferase [Candidatus Eisenbacteria bacterium]
MSVSKSAPTERFSDRVEEYLKYRPHYSPEVIAALRQACGLRSDHVIVDVGCGTGLLANRFLENGNRVIGVEPNAGMRQAGALSLARYAKFSMVAGSAEDTTLPDHHADFVMAGQAFHWFQPERTRREFARIVRPDGWAVLIWHDRDLESTPFLRAYEDFLQRHATDYAMVAHNKVANYGALERFFSPNRMHMVTQNTLQEFDREGLRGRLLSSSYAPREGPRAEAMLEELPVLFDRYAEGGRVVFEYHTRIYYGHLTP